ncbi:hypothetical protein GALL_529960 [mine drainage metagenome]|uniref:Uncharacterized protein n=1 Tax=mine drainage metagenome TaxID=410659 RepID=A0A1J5PJI7_9ZZZZ
MIDQVADRQATLDLELGVEAALGLLQSAFRQVGGEQLDPGPRNLSTHVLDGHGQGIDFLARAASRAPDADRFAAAQTREGGQDLLLEEGEGTAIAIEGGLAGRQGLDDRPGQPVVALQAQIAQHVVDRTKAFAARHRGQAALDEIGLLRVDQQAGARRADLRRQFAILKRHASPTSTSLEAMMSPSKGFMMYSLAPAASASRIWSRSFSTVQSTTVGLSPPGSRRR